MPDDKKPSSQEKNDHQITRRQFLTGTGAAVVAGGLIGGVIGANVFSGKEGQTAPASFTDIGGQTALRELAYSIPSSAGYLVHDSKKCAGCLSCMAACSAAHDKTASLSLSRIQITQNALSAFPFDLDQYVCRHCVSPLCVQNCPTGACHVDTSNGNVRVIDQDKCIGCQMCIKSCPHPPHRTIWNADINKSSKCDLCTDAPYLGKTGGVEGTQACVSVCPMGALAIVKTTPDQTDENGYDMNMRGKAGSAKDLQQSPLLASGHPDWFLG